MYGWCRLSFTSSLEYVVKFESVDQVVHLLVTCLVFEVRVEKLLFASSVERQEIYLGLALGATVFIHGFYG